MSDRSLVYLKAAAGVGKTSVIDAMLYAVIRSYASQAASQQHVALVLVPNRELRFDICQDLVEAKIIPS
jgi:superfamily II DNA/RNA helicase